MDIFHHRPRTPSWQLDSSHRCGHYVCWMQPLPLHRDTNQHKYIHPHIDIMQEVSRDFDNILFKIRYIIQTSCKDVILKSHWNITLSWFEQYDRDRIVKYWNLAPEVIENNKWEKLYQIIITYLILY